MKTDLGFNDSWIETNIDGISASQKSSTTRRTRRLGVVRVQDDPGPGQPVQGGHGDVGVVPGHVIVTEVICYYDHDVRRRGGGGSLEDDQKDDNDHC